MDYLTWLDHRPSGFRRLVLRGAETLSAQQSTLLENASGGKKQWTPEALARDAYRLAQNKDLCVPAGRRESIEKAFRALGGTRLTLRERKGDPVYEFAGDTALKALAIRLLDWAPGAPDIQALADVWLLGEDGSVAQDVVDAALASLRSFDTQEAHDLADEIQTEVGVGLGGAGFTQESLALFSRDMLEEELVRARSAVRRLQTQLREKNATLAQERQRYRQSQVERRVDEVLDKHPELCAVKDELLACQTVEEVSRRTGSFLRVARRGS